MERPAFADPKVEQIISQYRQVVGALDRMFVEMSKRTEWEKWRFDGFGSCGILQSTSEVGLGGIARNELIRLREEVNAATGLSRVDGKLTCPYHRANHGCVLGDLKSPLCIAWIENRDEVSEKFSVDFYQFKQFVYGALGKILFTKETDESLINPGDNEDFVAETLVKIESLTDRVLGAPVDAFPKVKIVSARPEYA